MAPQLFLGKEVVGSVKAFLKSEIEKLDERGIKPRLEVVMVGDDEGSQSYIKGLEKSCKELGIQMHTSVFAKDTSQEEFLDYIRTLNEDKLVNGILVMQPLPPGIDKKAVSEVISYAKDIDGMNLINIGKIVAVDETGFSPCTPAAVMEVLHYYNVEIEGKTAVVIGRSTIVGKPVALLLLNEHATVTICHSRTRNLPDVAASADILVVAVGRPKMVKKEWVKSGAVVIDVGINVVDGKLVGDVDFDDVSEVAGAITPVPGGIGSVTRTMLLKNLIKATKIQNGLASFIVK